MCNHSMLNLIDDLRFSRRHTTLLEAMSVHWSISPSVTIKLKSVKWAWGMDTMDGSFMPLPGLSALMFSDLHFDEISFIRRCIRTVKFTIAARTLVEVYGKAWVICSRADRTRRKKRKRWPKNSEISRTGYDCLLWIFAHQTIDLGVTVLLTKLSVMSKGVKNR